MATLSHAESRRLYSWWWDSHISPKNSKWLQENLTDMDSKVKTTSEREWQKDHHTKKYCIACQNSYYIFNQMEHKPLHTHKFIKRGEPFTSRRLYGISSVVEAIPSLVRQFLAGIKHLVTTIKVAFLLVVELGVFPLMCGWWLDIYTIRMLGTTIAQRVEFFSISPVASSLVYWFVGIIYMRQISIFVSLLHGVLRNRVLYFLRDPNPFRNLIDDLVHKHARQVLLPVVVYGSLIVMLMFLLVKLAMRSAPSMFPLDISVADPFTEILANMFLFQICIPFAKDHLNFECKEEEK